jgi:hypothetical protein
MVSLLLLWSCANEPVPTKPAVVPVADAHSPTVVLVRASLDLRGVRPTLDELAEVREDPATLDPHIEAFFEDPRWGERVVDLYAEVWGTVQDETQHPADALGLTDEPAFARAVGEEPLRILAEVATQDLPWTDIVTADWTMVDDQLAEAWPVEAEAGTGDANGWRRAHYTDGRPAAGAIAANGFWWRYETSNNNASRGRANQLSRILLCRDFLDTPVTFDRSVDLSDPAIVLEALRENPACATCHSNLDPLASLLGGFFVPRKSGVEEFRNYHPEREELWRTQTEVPPAYFGAPAATVRDLGRFIAADPEFVGCTVEQTAGLLLRQDFDLGDTDRLTSWRESFIQDDLRLKGLWMAILASPAYRGADLSDPQHTVHKLVSPDLLASQVEDLTGYRFTADGYDMLRTGNVGLQALAGGSDGEFSTRVSQDFSATLLLVQERIAQAAADHVVHNEPERLFAATVTGTPDDLDRALAHLHERVLSRPPTATEVADLAEHWHAVEALTGAPEDAWASVLTVLLRDPDFLLY